MCIGLYENRRKGGTESQIVAVRSSFLERMLKLILKTASYGPFGACVSFPQLTFMEYDEYRRELFFLVAFWVQVHIKKEQIAMQ